MNVVKIGRAMKKRIDSLTEHAPKSQKGKEMKNSNWMATIFIIHPSLEECSDS